MRKPSLAEVAAPPPPAPFIPKRGLNSRVDEALLMSLESMAKALGKSVSGLAGELLEHGIHQLSAELPTLRPDLVHGLTDESQHPESDFPDALYFVPCGERYPGVYDLKAQDWLPPVECYRLWLEKHGEIAPPVDADPAQIARDRDYSRALDGNE
jgi:hypothetical protein